MGSGSSRAAYSRLLQHYSQVQTQPDQAVLQHKTTGQLVLLKQFTPGCHQQRLQLLQRLTYKSQHPYENLLPVIQYQQFETKGTGVVCALFKLTACSLADQIGARSSQGLFFNQDELISLFCCVALALKELKAAGETHGSVCPANLFLSEEGTALLLDPLAARIPAAEPWKGLLLPPEVLLCIEQEEQHQVDGSKADVFGLGMTLLECSSLQSSLSCYDYKLMRLDMAQVRRRLRLLEKQYSPVLVSLLEQMLEEHEDQRLGIEQLECMLEFSHEMQEADYLSQDQADQEAELAPQPQSAKPAPDQGQLLFSSQKSQDQQSLGRTMPASEFNNSQLIQRKFEHIQSMLSSILPDREDSLQGTEPCLVEQDYSSNHSSYFSAEPKIGCLQEHPSFANYFAQEPAQKPLQRFPSFRNCQLTCPRLALTPSAFLASSPLPRADSRSSKGPTLVDKMRRQLQQIRIKQQGEMARMVVNSSPFIKR